MYVNTNFGIYGGDRILGDRDATTQEIADYNASVVANTAKQNKDKATLATAKANANLTLLSSASPAQINTFCTNKFPTLTTPEHAVLADILLAVQVIAKGIL
jgi:hypothetical protein